MARLVVMLVVPITLLTVAAAGWYIFTGETPMEMLESLSGDQRIDMSMPPRPGPEHPDVSLIHPPAANDPDVKMAMEPVAPPKLPEDGKAAEHKGEDAPAPVSTPASKEEVSKPVASSPAEPLHEASHTPESLLAPAPGETPAAPAQAMVSAPPPPPPLVEPMTPPGGEPLAAPSFAHLAARDDLKALPAAPSNELLRTGPSGPLPIMANGKEPRVVYARPFVAEKKLPQLAVVVVGLGLSKEATEAAISKLPPEISLSFSPYAANLDGWIKKARNSGHEVLLDLPLEPPNFPLRDAGPLSVLSHQGAAEAVEQLETILAKATGYVGVAAGLHSPVASSEGWVPILKDLKGRGLLLVGDGLVGVAQSDVPHAVSISLVADETPFRSAIDTRFARLLLAAQRDGSAVTYLSARPVSFERVLAWVATFPQKGVVLAPVSAVVTP